MLGQLPTFDNQNLENVKLVSNSSVFDVLVMCWHEIWLLKKTFGKKQIIWVEKFAFIAN